LFIIGKNDGTTDAGYDSSITATHLLNDATGYVDYRRVSSIKTDGSSNVHIYNQKIIGGVRRTLWDTSATTTVAIDRSGSGPSNDVVTANAPPDVYTKVFGEASYEGAAVGDEASIFNVDQAALATTKQMILTGGSTGDTFYQSTYFEVYTNTNAQIKVYQSGGTSSNVNYTIRGWEE
jgi:hypothetical protein